MRIGFDYLKVRTKNGKHLEEITKRILAYYWKVQRIFIFTELCLVRLLWEQQYQNYPHDIVKYTFSQLDYEISLLAGSYIYTSKDLALYETGTEELSFSDYGVILKDASAFEVPNTPSVV